MTAAAVILATIAYINVVAVKKKKKLEVV